MVEATTQRGLREYWNELAYTGPDRLAGRYMRTFWHPVYLAEQLVVRRPVSLRIMGEEFTLYRGESGGVFAVASRCAHRESLLSLGWVEGDCLRCFYHGWKYTGDGQCVEQPAEDESFAAKVRIASHPAVEYLGLIFVYFGGGEAPPLPQYEEFASEGGVLMATASRVWPCNYFNRIDNATDEVHVAFVHRDSAFSKVDLDEIPVMSGSETDYGVEARATMPDGGVRIVHFHMPNINQFTAPPTKLSHGKWSDYLAWRVPVDDEHCISFLVQHVALTADQGEVYIKKRREQMEREANSEELAEGVLQGKYRLEDVTAATYRINMQDYVGLVGQGAIPDREHERLGRSDACVILLRNLWARELQALEQGQPLKRWIRPDRLTATSGLTPA